MFLESSPDYQNGKASAGFIQRLGTAILLSALACLCISCAGISSAVLPSTSSSDSNGKISVSPAAVTISSGAQQQFSVTQTSTSTGAVHAPAILWHASAGTISESGLFTAPAVTSSTRVTVIATSTVDPSITAVSQVTVAPPKLSKIAISLSPSATTLSSGGRQQFSAALTSTSNTAVTWQASAGTISSSGLFTAPSVTSSSRVTVTATSVADGSVAATSQVTVVPLSKLLFTMASMPAGTAGTPYTTTLTATGGTAPYVWQITGGFLPQGLSLDKSSGVVAGITSQTGTFTFTASVTDASSTRATASLALSMSSATTGNFDGPAELPRVYVASDLSDTPAPGSVISVAKGGDFQRALDSAKCGDTIALQAGAVFTGAFTVPAQACDDAHWIIVRTSAPDSSLPPEGTRISPCYAGVSSLPGRPALNCASTNNVLAKLQFSAVGSGPLILANGASHYRFIGLEITRTPGTGVVYNLVSHQTDGAADHIILDRSWVHGTAHDETTRGVMLSGAQYAAVIDSYFTDFHCVARTGWCGDSQAIAGGLGSLSTGPLKIVDNFLEAASQSVLLGGGPATITPADIEIRRNHMFKPLTWMVGQPGYVGGADGNPFIVKNLIEFKNAQRVLIEGNVFENAWGGFSQAGFAILLTPKNQTLGGANVCPICQVTDVTIRYSTISHVGGGLQIANGLSDNGGRPLAGERYSVHDLTADDIDPTKYDGYGTFAQVSMGPGAPVLQSVTISHVTAFQPNVLLNLGDDTTMNPAMRNFVFTNNLVNAGTAPTQTTGGGTANCAFYSAPLTSLAACFTAYTFSHNAIIATPANFSPSKYPAGNYFPASATAVDFVNYNNGNGGDYHLQSASRYKNAGTDGLDLGANVDAVQAAVAGVL
jgi:Putative Ig domain